MCVCVCERERERECVCVRERERLSVRELAWRSVEKSVGFSSQRRSSGRSDAPTTSAMDPTMGEKGLPRS